MDNRLLIAGFGGQGIMLIGQMLGYAASEADKEALFLPQYGPEQRGGTASCTVILADEPIGSPVVEKVDVFIAMNNTSLQKFKSKVKKGGIILLNSEPKEEDPGLADVQTYYIPVDILSDKIGSRKVANIIMLGAYIEKSKALTKEEILQTIGKKLAKKPEMMELNKIALQTGIDYYKNLTMERDV